MAYGYMREFDAVENAPPRAWELSDLVLAHRLSIEAAEEEFFAPGS
jgi:hypothetical protein